MRDERVKPAGGKAVARRAREARLAEALRANLRRRKDAARQDTGPDKAGHPPDKPKP
jgi:hypothetical protein